MTAGDKSLPDATRSEVSTLAKAATLVSVVLVLAAGAFGAVTLRMFVFPPVDHVERVDAVVVLSGDHGERLPAALHIIERGAATVLVHAGAPDSRQVKQLCTGGQAFEVVCPHPRPDNTRAEARAVADLARERGWRSLALVTSTPHVTRAGMLFRRCFDGQVDVVAAWPGMALARNQIPREWMKAGYQLVVDRGC